MRYHTEVAGVVSERTDLQGDQARGEIPWQKLHDEQVRVSWHVRLPSGHLENHRDAWLVLYLRSVLNRRLLGGNRWPGSKEQRIYLLTRWDWLEQSNQ